MLPSRPAMVSPHVTCCSTLWAEDKPNGGVTEHLASVPGRVTLSNVSERKDNMRLGLSLATNPKDNSFLVRRATPLLSPALLPAQPTHVLLSTPCTTAPSTLLMVRPYGPTGTGPDGCGSSCRLGPLLQWVVQKKKVKRVEPFRVCTWRVAWELRSLLSGLASQGNPSLVLGQGPDPVVLTANSTEPEAFFFLLLLVKVSLGPKAWKFAQ